MSSKRDLQDARYSPRPDLVAAGKVRDHSRSIQVPPHNITTIDPVRMKEIDDIYKVAQAHREQYKDRTGRLYPLICFKPHAYKYQCAPSMPSEYFSKYPQTHVAYKTPPVLAPPLGGTLHIPYLFELNMGGVYSRSPCTAYKH